MIKNIKFIITAILFSLIVLTSAYSENRDEKTEYKTFKSVTTHFTVYSYESTERAIELSYELEKLYTFYIQFFEITSPKQRSLSVTLFQTEEEMRNVLKEKINGDKSSGRDENFLLSVSTPYSEKAQLYFVSGNSPLHTKLFNAYTFLLFFETQFPNTSPWIKEGLTAYFSMVEYYSSKQSHLVTPNYNTMEKLQKKIRIKAIYPLEKLLSAENPPLEKSNYESFRIASWGLIQYIFNKSEDSIVDNLLSYIKESNLEISPDMESDEVRPFSLDQETYEKELQYIKKMESPSKLIESAITLYQEEKYSDALKILKRASKLSNHYYIPYYRGLISYKNKKYKEALKDFEKAGTLGLPEALSCYCEGLCYWNLKERIYAAKLLQKAAQLDPEKFKKTVSKLLET